MVRVQPARNSSEVNTSHAKQTILFENEDTEHNVPTTHITNGEHNHSRPLMLRCMLSIRLFLITMIMFVVLVTAVSIWITAYKVNEMAALESVSVLIDNMNEKISTFVKSKLDVPRRLAMNMADDYHNGYIQMDDSVRRYLVSKVNSFNVSIVSVCLGEEGNNVLYGFSRDTSHPIPDVFSYKAVNAPNSTFIMSALNASAEINYAIPFVRIPNYVVLKADYYVETMKTIFPNYSDGAFGKFYQVIESNMQTFWPSPLYDRNLLKMGIKKIMGIAKANLSLEGIQSFLKQVKVLERGYLVLCEMDSNYIIGGSIDLPNLRIARVPATNITSRNAGKLIGKVLEAHHQTNQNSLDIPLNQDGINFLVSSRPFEYYNVKWRMIVVFEESEIKKGIILSSYVILGVSLFVCLVGIVMSVLSGWIVTNPLFNLQQDFKKIDILDLNNVKKRASLFTEVNNIYHSLDNTVKWLSEFRAFLPDNVLNTLQQTEETEPVSKKIETKETPQHGLSYREDQTSEQATSMSSIHAGKQSKGLFGLGLNLKECCVLSIHVDHVNFSSTEMDPSTLSDLMSKLLTGISTISKAIRADLQINQYNHYSLFLFDKMNNSSIGLDACLKIITSLNRLNSQLVNNSESPFLLSIGVASGECLQGNIGSKQMRYFSTIGRVVERANDLCRMSTLLEVPVLVDQSSMNSGIGSFIFRPIDRYLAGDGCNIETIYQLIKSNHVENDEWLYELEQKKQNSKYEKFNEIFHRLFDGKHLDNKEFEELKVSIMTAGSEDKIIARLGRLLDLVDDSKYLLTYRSTIQTSIDSFLLEKEIILK